MWHLSLHWLFLRLSWNGLHTCTDPCLLSWQLFTRTYVVFTTTSEINIWHRCYFQTLPASRQWFENKNHPDLKDAKCLSSSEIFFCCLSFVILNSKLQRSMWCRVWQRIHVPVWLQLPDLRRVLQRLWISVHHKWDVSPLIPTPQPRQPLYVRLNSTMQSCYTLKPCCLCVCDRKLVSRPLWRKLQKRSAVHLRRWLCEVQSVLFRFQGRVRCTRWVIADNSSMMCVCVLTARHSEQQHNIWTSDPGFSKPSNWSWL